MEEKIDLPLMPFPEDVKATPKERMGFYLGQILSMQQMTKKRLNENKDLAKMKIYEEKEKTLNQLQEVIDSIIKEYPDLQACIDAVPLLDQLKKLASKVKE